MLVYSLGLHVSFLIHGPKIIQKSSFLQFCAELSKKPKSVKAIYINASESSYYTQWVIGV